MNFVIASAWKCFEDGEPCEHYDGSCTEDDTPCLNCNRNPFFKDNFKKKEEDDSPSSFDPKLFEDLDKILEEEEEP